MSGQTSIENVALDFITMYKRYKDMGSAARRRWHGEERKNLLGRQAVKRERLDKHPC